MTGLESIAAGGVITKELIEKSDGLFKSLFGKAFTETGEMIADQVKFRRFKNQLKIFKDAEAYLAKNEFDPQKINLKVVAPMIEFSSYEEDANLQKLWSNLIANILTKPFPVVLQQNALEVLNKISNDEVKVLNYIYENLLTTREERFRKISAQPSFQKRITKPEDLRIDTFSFKIREIAERLHMVENEIEIIISNLAALGTLKYETTVEVSSAEKSSEDPEDTSVDIDLDVYDYDRIRLTRLGYAFVEICKEP